MSSQWPSSTTSTTTMALSRSKRSNILVVDDDPLIADLVQMSLQQAGYDVTVRESGETGISAAVETLPSLVLLDVMLPDMDGVSVCRSLRDNAATRSIPIIMLSALDTNDQKVSSFDVGADDYIVKPFHVPELLARVRTQLRHVSNSGLSDLTQLPGNTAIKRTIRAELERGGDDLSILYIDLDDFKAYNDAYGFLKGNELIRLTAEAVCAAVTAADPAHGFCGHVGGDDFVAVTRTRGVERVCDEIIERFNRERDAVYTDDDRARGYIVSVDRRGQTQHFPLAALSIGVVTTSRRAIADEWEVSHIAADVKKMAKSLTGSAYYIDQRGES